MSTCGETDDGATVTIEKDASDPDGWSERMIVADAGGVRFERDIRAVWDVSAAVDGGFVLTHVEDAVSRYDARGTPLWKTPHPRCGAPETAVGYDGRVVLGCGYSLVAFAPDGTYQWQKWPFGNQSLPRPLLQRDGTMIVRSGAAIAKLDAGGEVRWKIETGWNRYVLPIGVLLDGNLVFRTSMAEAHSQGDIHFYYPSEPDELFVVTRDGVVVSRSKLGTTPAWPATKPWTAAFRAGRI